MLELGPGWYSAMAQGQAMSLLIRAAHHSGDPRYLRAAARATTLFTINATQGEVIMYTRFFSGLGKVRLGKVRTG